MNFSAPRHLAQRAKLKNLPFAAFAALALSTSANAQALGGGRNNHCATRQGGDFVAIAGSEACVRLDGHVRVETGAHAYRPGHTAALQDDGVRHASETSHVRVGSTSNWSDVTQR